jgi:hypothetical protein
LSEEKNRNKKKGAKKYIKNVVQICLSPACCCPKKEVESENKRRKTKAKKDEKFS